MFSKINQAQFIDEFRQYGRQNQFSHGALVALFNHLEEMEELRGEELQLDVIALCCGFAEYATLDEYNKEHNKDADPVTMDDIDSSTPVVYIGKTGSFLIEQY